MATVTLRSMFQFRHPLILSSDLPPLWAWKQLGLLPVNNSSSFLLGCFSRKNQLQHFLQFFWFISLGFVFNVLQVKDLSRIFCHSPFGIPCWNPAFLLNPYRVNNS
jgi:hypothetical protein